METSVGWVHGGGGASGSEVDRAVERRWKALGDVRMCRWDARVVVVVARTDASGRAVCMHARHVNRSANDTAEWHTRGSSGGGPAACCVTSGDTGRPVDTAKIGPWLVRGRMLVARRCNGPPIWGSKRIETRAGLVSAARWRTPTTGRWVPAPALRRGRG